MEEEEGEISFDPTQKMSSDHNSEGAPVPLTTHITEVATIYVRSNLSLKLVVIIITEL